MKERTKRIWKKFLKYKALEILSVPFIIFVPYYVGKLINFNNWMKSPDKFIIWVLGAFVFGLLAVWITTNWEKAAESVDAETLKSK